MGAESFAGPGEDKTVPTLVALMLSSQTKDQVVAQAMNNLRGDGLLSIDALADVEPETLNKHIYSVGFRNNKTKYLKAAAKLIQSDFGGKVPDTLEGLQRLPGVGPKMAFLVLNIAFDKPNLGIGVDTHMHRIANKLGWVSSNTPEQTRLQLEAWLPPPHWAHVNLTMVGLGQMIQQPAERAKLLKFLDTWQPKRKAEALDLLKRCGLTMTEKSK